MRNKPIIILSLFVCLVSCKDADIKQQTKAVQTDPDIQVIKDDLKHLKKEIAVIRQALTDIHKIAMDTPEPAAQPIPAELTLDLNPDDPLLGSAEAKIAIIEFSDFQCPYCKRFAEQTFPPIKKNYIDTGKVRYIARDFPLDFHPQAQGAAIAASCAQAQGAYWPMRDSLFSNIRNLGPERYTELASNLKLDLTKFNQCSKDKSKAEEVLADQGFGASLGISGTPSFLIGIIKGDKLINARLIVGAQGYQTFSTVINAISASAP
ncbi:DsbA family protein [Candidatus Colwellia aromaticivorans]|uniref:DsbA family protein n=1 Tax=Candidatus Colwellia aromaticivorans TaxID=2267621 RepID=UPI000DF2A804|nr:thioredoxin domain-containing protein [Candidatus Colwellia aromaticivorans]